MKRILAILLTALLLHPHVATADEAKKTLHFVINIDESTVVDRLLHAAFQRLGYNITMDAAAMTYAIQMANGGERDALASQVAGLEARAPNLVMVPEQLLGVSFPAFARADSNLRINSWEDLSGLRVGHLFQKAYIINHLPKDIAGSIQRELFHELHTALENGECDVIITSATLNIEPVIGDGVKRVGILESLPSYAYLNKKYADLVPAVAQSLRDMKTDGTYAKIIAGIPLMNNLRQKVLHISSYHPDDPWESQLKLGLGKVFGGNKSITYYNVPLYANRFHTEYERAKNAYYPIRIMLLSDPPDLILVSDNSALLFACSYYNVMFRNIPVIFCAASGDPGFLWQLGRDHTGVWQSPSATETVGEILKLYPNTRTLFVVNDYTDSGQGMRFSIERDLANIAPPLSIIHNEDVPHESLLETLSALPDDAAILWGCYAMDRDGFYFTQENIQALVRARTSAPVFGLTLSGLGHGHVGGKYIDPETQGELAAQLALRVLSGEKAADIPQLADTSQFNRWIFDAAEVERLGLKAGFFPAGADWVNRTRTLYESNPQAFFLFIFLAALAVLIIAGLAIFTLTMRQKNRRLLEIQKNLHSAEELLAKDAEIIAAKERLDVALAASQAGVWEVDLKNDECFFDPSASALYELREPSPISISFWVKHLREKMGEFGDPAYFTLLQSEIIVAPNVISEAKIQLEDGTFRHIHNYAKTLYSESGKPLRTIGMSIDITPRVKMAQELQQAKEAADAASQAKSRFLANMSHEIRTPMNAVLGMLKIAGGTTELDRIRKCLTTAESSSRHLLDIINDILDISKIESGKLELFNEPFSFERLLHDVARVIIVRTAEKRQELQMRLYGDIPPRFMGDSIRLTQVIMNLLSNAVKFSGLETVIRLEARCLECSVDQALIECSVTDQGIGMTPEQIRNLFQAFQQADNSITKRYGGTGLGLAISAKIVDLMGGDISVRSIPDQGSTFTFTVALGIADEVPDSEQLETLRQIPRMRVLIVEDDQEAGDYFCSLLIRHGAVCRSVCPNESLEEVLRALEASGEPVNLVLLDEDERRAGRIERIKNAGLKTPPAFVLMDGRGNDLPSPDSGAPDMVFLQKPVLPATLLAGLVEALDGKKRAAPANQALCREYRGKRLLLVEDNDINREIVKALLVPSGVRITEAENGQEAVRIFTARPGDFDLILMDIQMPVMDGYAASRAIRSCGHSAGKTVPILAMTANAFREDVEAALAAEMNGHISKPLDEKKMCRELDKYLLEIPCPEQPEPGKPGLSGHEAV